MKKTRFFSSLLLFCLVFALLSPPAFALEAPEITAKSAVIVDLGSGRTIWEKNADEPRSPASLTKIMTGLLTVEAVEAGAADMDELVTAGADCRYNMDDSSSTAWIGPGEQMSCRDLFYCALVVSANEACNILASRLSGSIAGFVERMNARAAALGCENTHFADCNGLSHENRTTARELSVILREALSHEDFLAAYTTAYYDVPATNQSGERHLVTTDALTARDSYYSQYGDYYYEYALGAKTGYTRAAGYCLASVAEKDGVRLLIVVMGCPGPLSGDAREPESFNDTIRLYDWAFDNFSLRPLFAPDEEICLVPVAHAPDGGAVLSVRDDPVLLLPADGSEQLDYLVELTEGPLRAPIAAGAVLGRLTVLVDGQAVGPYDLITRSEIPVALPSPEDLAPDLSPLLPWLVSVFGSLGLQP